MLEEALSFWNAIKGKVREAIREDTRNAVRMERYDVTTAPNGTKIGVSQPFGDEIFVPYSAEVANARVGDTVLLVWWNSLSTAKAYYFGDGYKGGAVTSVDGRTGAVSTVPFHITMTTASFTGQIDALTERGTYTFVCPAGASGMPETTGFMGLVFRSSANWVSVLATTGGDNAHTYRLYKAGGVWGNWVHLVEAAEVTYSSIDSITQSGFYIVTGTPGLLIHEQWDANYATQIFQKYTGNNTTGVLQFRVKSSGTWGAWRTIQDSTNTAYAAGDTFSIAGSSVRFPPLQGYITSSTTQVHLGVYVPKSLANISTVTVTALQGGIRTTAGGYLDGGSDSSNWIGSSYTVVANKVSDNFVGIMITKSSAFTNVTNNTPVTLALRQLTLSFS